MAFKTLYISDLDGTLLNSDAEISNFSIDVINKFIEKGNLFSIATARSQESAFPKIKQLNLNLPCIVHNGVLIYDPIQKNYIWEKYISNEIVHKILEIYYQLGLNPILYGINEKAQNKVYYTMISNNAEKFYIEDRIANKDTRFEKVDKLPVENHQILEINVIEPKEKIADIYSEIHNKFNLYIHKMNDIYSPGYTWLEIMNSSGNKRSALEFLKNYLNVDRIVCFGDNTNDISMFKFADESYAVENAVKELKLIASRIIQGNNDDGVASYLKQL